MLSQVKKMHDGKGNEMIWLLEHNDIYTGGTSSKQSDLKNTKNIKISKTNRGGQWTWHGPGQRIVYFVLDLNMRNKDVRWFVNKLEQLIINTLLDFNINSTRRKNLILKNYFKLKISFIIFDKTVIVFTEYSSKILLSSLLPSKPSIGFS